MRSDSSDSEQETKIQKQQQLYTKLKVLGEGSMGKAYLVKSNKDQQLYVMKRINIGYLSAQEKETAKREAQLHSIVSHPNIISFKQIYHTTKEKLCIIMEYAEGGDLDNFIEKRQGKSFTEDQVIQLFAQICLGVRQIHSKKIIHRDLKGANIFLTDQHKVKIGDFGISKIAQQTIQASKSFVGTPYYLSPQMVEGKKYSTKADIWSLGVILYHLCALRLPFEASSLPLLALKILKGSFPPVTGPYSRELKSLILSLLQVNQNKRPNINEILAKPFITRYTGQSPIINKNANLTSRKNLLPQTLPTQIKKKQVINKQGEKLKQKQKREKARQKRDQLRKQMQQQLRQKRRQNQKNVSPTKISDVNLEKHYRSSPQIDETVKNGQNRLVQEKPIEKPWKMKKDNVKKNKQIEFKILLPEDRPKKQPSPPKPIIPQNDFKVEIFVSKKPELVPQIQEQNLQIEDQQQIYSEGYQSSSNDDDEAQKPHNDLQELLRQVSGAQQAVFDLKDNFHQIQLLQESEVFDKDEQSPKEGKIMTKEDEESLRFINSSQNLEECRQILEEGLGQEKFIKSYNILNQHLTQSTEKRLKGQIELDYTFDRQIIRDKLFFLEDAQFTRYVILLYTLIIMEDEEMKKNLDD